MVNQSNVKSGIMLVVGAMITILLGASLLPTAFDEWFNATTSGWGTTTATLWPIAPAFVVLAVVLYYVGSAFDVF